MSDGIKIKVKRVLVEDNITGENEMTDLDGVLVFGFKGHDIVLSAIGNPNLADILRACRALGAILGAGWVRGVSPAATEVVLRIAASELVKGFRDPSLTGRIAAASSANEIIYGAER